MKLNQKMSGTKYQNTRMHELIREGRLSAIYFGTYNSQSPTVLAGLISLLGKPDDHRRISHITQINWLKSGVFFYIDHHENSDTCYVKFSDLTDRSTIETIYSWLYRNPA